MNNRGKLVVLSQKSRVFTSIEKQLLAFLQELIGVIISLTKNEQFIIGSDHFIVISRIKNQLPRASPRKEILFIVFNYTNAIDGILQVCISFQKRINNSVADLLSRSSTQEELQLTQL